VAVGEAAVKTDGWAGLDGWAPPGVFLFGAQAAPPVMAESVRAKAIWFFFTDSPSKTCPGDLLLNDFPLELQLQLFQPAALSR
jgi:hypothetical protein